MYFTFMMQYENFHLPGSDGEPWQTVQALNCRSRKCLPQAEERGRQKAEAVGDQQGRPPNIFICYCGTTAENMRYEYFKKEN